MQLIDHVERGQNHMSTHGSVLDTKGSEVLTWKSRPALEWPSSSFSNSIRSAFACSISQYKSFACTLIFGLGFACSKRLKWFIYLGMDVSTNYQRCCPFECKLHMHNSGFKDSRTGPKLHRAIITSFRRFVQQPACREEVLLINLCRSLSRHRPQTSLLSHAGIWVWDRFKVTLVPTLVWEMLNPGCWCTIDCIGWRIP